MSPAALKLMDAVRTSERAPYRDVLKRAAGLSEAEMKNAMRELDNAGMVMRCTAPTGEMLYPTLRSVLPA